MKKKLGLLRNKKVLFMLACIVTVVVAISGTLYYAISQGRVAIDDSLVSTPIITIAPVTSGKLQEIDVYENEVIKKGDQIAIVNGQPLYADTDGLVTMANTQIGSIVGSSSPVAQIIDPSQMRIAGTIDENKGLSDIHVGQVVSFTVDALPGKQFWGYVDEIGPTAKQTQLSFSISSERPTQQFVVYARFNAEASSEIRNGMSAKMSVFTKTK